MSPEAFEIIGSALLALSWPAYRIWRWCCRPAPPSRVQPSKPPMPDPVYHPSVRGRMPWERDGLRLCDRIALAEEHGKCGQCLDAPGVTFCGRCRRGAGPRERSSR